MSAAVLQLGNGAHDGKQVEELDPVREAPGADDRLGPVAIELALQAADRILPHGFLHLELVGNEHHEERSLPAGISHPDQVLVEPGEVLGRRPAGILDSTLFGPPKARLGERGHFASHIPRPLEFGGGLVQGVDALRGSSPFPLEAPPFGALGAKSFLVGQATCAGDEPPGHGSLAIEDRRQEP